MIPKRQTQRRPHRTNETGRRVGMLYAKARTAGLQRHRRAERRDSARRYNPMHNPNYAFNYGFTLYIRALVTRQRNAGILPPLEHVRGSTLKHSRRLA